MPSRGPRTVRWVRYRYDVGPYVGYGAGTVPVRRRYVVGT
eukprot:CAMPEP_0171641678 /NCGR_PEP_ID=MMETSP0990-20121206/31383_1 /TAXON_ID=483369 /ORGANISM="non described non described, Strain CCMP2098" /LENGTH=39 /DNA_ID= /DNA_START= /DNA_END= /DNA_ORIENTATION=